MMLRTDRRFGPFWWSARTRLRRCIPGTLLCGAVTGGAWLLERGEVAVFGRAWLEALVLAIVLGTLVRTMWAPGPRIQPGIQLCAKTLLEIAVVLLGASVRLDMLVAAGPGLLIGIGVVVVVALLASYGIGRCLGLSYRMAVLVACGNAICGNSAIAAVAPVIGASGADITASIAFTAVLGVLVVLGLPVLGLGLHLGALPYGALAGLTVYAVPQVLAATSALGPTAVQIGTLVKLVRVLMLGPVVLSLSMITRRRGPSVSPTPAGRRPAFVPWFIVGFLALAVVRALGGIPEGVQSPLADVSLACTLLSMAGLGLGTDLRQVAQAGGRMMATVSLSLLVLGLTSFGLVWGLGLR